jgi:signal peptidase I
MEPTIRAGERVLVNTLSQNPQRGSLVQFDSGFRYGLGDREPVNFVKRVVAVPGDTVAIEAGRLVVNGAVVEEDYPTVTTEDYPTVEVPVDHYFVLGDNRAESYDSRFLGPIPEGRIQGRAYVIP